METLDPEVPPLSTSSINKSEMKVLTGVCYRVFAKHNVPFEVREIILKFAYEKCCYCYKTFPSSSIMNYFLDISLRICVKCDERVGRIQDDE
jgi:hypothetical protein